MEKMHAEALQTEVEMRFQAEDDLERAPKPKLKNC
jgi:hypothetical protein